MRSLPCCTCLDCNGDGVPAGVDSSVSTSIGIWVVCNMTFLIALKHTTSFLAFKVNSVASLLDFPLPREFTDDSFSHQFDELETCDRLNGCVRQFTFESDGLIQDNEKRVSMRWEDVLLDVLRNFIPGQTLSCASGAFVSAYLVHSHAHCAWESAPLDKIYLVGYKSLMRIPSVELIGVVKDNPVW